jgi:hypothetical protein
VGFILAKLKSIQLIFKTSSVQDFADKVARNPLVFVNLPTDNVETFALDEAAAANSAILDRGEWLLEIRKFVNTVPSNLPRNTRLLAKVLLSHAEKEITALHKLKMQEWERQQIAAVAAGVGAVKTGASFIFPV